MSVNPFAGLDHEDPYNHLSKLYELAVSLTLIGKANEWFIDHTPHVQDYWNQVEEKFMTRYFPRGKFMDLKTNISTFTQGYVAITKKNPECYSWGTTNVKATIRSY
ncbi:hypothetical protein Lal_00018673 [Lupinus albus]|nr:hypothetical protein Lal_00018673 [Lupinus albus]